jgi:hypothetical protein
MNKMNKQQIVLQALNRNNPATTIALRQEIGDCELLKTEDAINLVLAGLKLDGLLDYVNNKWVITKIGRYWIDNNITHGEPEMANAKYNPTPIINNASNSNSETFNNRKLEQIENIIKLAQAQIDSIAMNSTPPVEPANTFIEIRNTAMELMA